MNRVREHGRPLPSGRRYAAYRRSARAGDARLDRHGDVVRPQHHQVRHYAPAGVELGRHAVEQVGRGLRLGLVAGRHDHHADHARRRTVGRRRRRAVQVAPGAVPRARRPALGPRSRRPRWRSRGGAARRRRRRARSRRRHCPDRRWPGRGLSIATPTLSASRTRSAT